MEELARCEEREREQSTRAWEVILPSKPEAAPQRWDRIEPNCQPPGAARLARRKARKWLPEGNAGREAPGSRGIGAHCHLCPGKDYDPSPFPLERKGELMRRGCRNQGMQTPRMKAGIQELRYKSRTVCPYMTVYPGCLMGAMPMPEASHG